MGRSFQNENVVISLHAQFGFTGLAASASPSAWHSRSRLHHLFRACACGSRQKKPTLQLFRSSLPVDTYCKHRMTGTSKEAQMLDYSTIPWQKNPSKISFIKGDWSFIAGLLGLLTLRAPAMMSEDTARAPFMLEDATVDCIRAK